MRYIRDIEAEWLLRNYHNINGIIASLDIECSEPDDDIISSKTFSGGLTGMPFPPIGNNSDKTGDVALAYKNTLKVENSATNKVYSQLMIVLSKLDEAIKRLPSTQRIIIKARYIELDDEGKPVTWKDISKKLHLNERSCKEHRPKAISKIVVRSCITLDEFNVVKKICEREGEQ